MNIQDEVKQLFNLILNHPEDIEKLKLFIKMRNDTVFKYDMDRKKEDKVNIKEKIRKQKYEEELHKIDEKRRKFEQKKTKNQSE
ncbi:MAG TPA: hypothetical protein PLO89_04370 [Spirochaetota bacterium]|nr:hypothetical protein [Spirochaetota bacterium]